MRPATHSSFAAAALPLRRPLASLPDMELVALSVGGSRAAFGELVRRHSSAVRVLLRRMGADEATGDDVAQDAFLIAFERIGEFRGEGGFCPWVRRIAARLYVKKWRKGANTEQLDDEDPQDQGGEGEGAAADRIDLEAALNGLSKAERMCVSLCFGAGLTHAEVAEALGAPVGTVKSHVKRGLEKLRKRLGAPAGRPQPAVAEV